MTSIKLENLLRPGAGGGLDKIVQTAQNMDLLTSALRVAVPPDMAENLLAANVRDDGELVVICSASAWASRLRFEEDALVAAAVKAGFAASSMRVTVSQQ